MKATYVVRHADEVERAACPCGTTRRILTAADNPAASVHVVRISRDSATHYHTRQTEFYYVLRGEGEILLDGVAMPIRAGHAICIPPNVQHRARGDLEILNVVVPAFDDQDEYIVGEQV